MEAEARHIIGLSMNKILASRGKKGGVNLHRNLMIASVLIKARTIYLTSAAEQRRNSTSETVTVTVGVSTPSNEVEARDSEAEISCEVEDMDTAVQPEETRSVPVVAEGDLHQGNISTNIVVDNFTNLSNEAMLLGNHTPELDNLSCDVASAFDDRSNDTTSMSVEMLEHSNISDDTDAEQCKENVAPLSETTVSPRRKRAYTEVECAVISIGGTPDVVCAVTNDNNDMITHDANEESDHRLSCYNNRSNSNQSNSDNIHSCLKRIKLDGVDIRNSNRTTIKHQPTLDMNLHVASGVRSVGFCGSPGSSVYDSFTSQGSSLRSPPMLLGTV